MRSFLLVVSCLAVVGCASSSDSSRRSVALATHQDSISYAIGVNLGKNIKRDSVVLNATILAQGIDDAVAGTPKLTEEQLTEVMNVFQKEMTVQQAERGKHAAGGNKVAGQQFLTENARRPGVITLPSGLQYEVITQGTGPRPTQTDVVVTRYRGTLIDGTEFDNSAKRGGTSKFPVSGVIRGWTEALQLMNVGSTWKLFIPSELAYGDQGGPGGQIGPNSALIFELTLEKVEGR